MYKKLFIFLFFTITVIHTPFATADFLVANGSATEDPRVLYSTWRSASDGYPAGYRTQGWYKIAPASFLNLPVPKGNRSLYIRVEDPNGTEIKPLDHAIRDNYPFWMHPIKPFTNVETGNGELLESNLDQASLTTATLYEYTNEGIHIITPLTDCDVDQGVADLPAQKIYNQAINSVVFILTDEGSGSGVLIDKERRLVVTNQHVTGDAAEVGVVFPYTDQNGTLRKDLDFYLNNVEWLINNNYATQGRILAQNVKNDLAIVELDWLPPTAQEIQHDFSQNVEDSMEKGDKVHILGNPESRLWNWTQGTFLSHRQVCFIGDGELVGCLEMEGDTHGGNSGGPVLNGQGVLIGILTAGTDETVSLAATTRNVKVLLNTLRYTFKILNHTGVTVMYQIKWSNDRSWKNDSLQTGSISTHWLKAENVSQGYPKIRFDYIAGDQQVTYRTYRLDTSLSSGDNTAEAPTYFFGFNQRGDRLDLYHDTAAAPLLSKTPSIETILLPNYPNPFNPETWIPYQLADPAEVTVAIYAADGTLVRTLGIGHQAAGRYENRSRAAYWDGKNDLGELVSSGLYFYTLTAGDFSATRKMLIRK